MADTPDFANNPFASLSRKQFPAKEKTGKAAAPRNAQAANAGQGDATESEDEARLFLEAVRSAAPAGAQKQRARDTFRLETRQTFQKARETLQTQRPPASAVRSAPSVQALATSPEGGAPQEPPQGTGAPEGDSTFFRAMRDVKPLSGKGRAVTPPIAPAPGTPPAETSMQDVLDGKVEFALALTGEYLEGYVVGLDELTMNKLRAGQYSPEAHLDLHGLNAMQAFQALVGFFRSAWYKGLRTVLVVPGRGRNSPDGVGILREKLQSWLTQEPFKRVVLAFCTARPSDGGAGSVYVLLRKMRKKGKIFWERMPADPDLF